MNAFELIKADSIAQAIGLLNGDVATKLIAGGTNLIDLMKENVVRPDRLVDVTHLPLNRIERTQEGGLRIGALVTNSDLAYDPLVREHYPLLSSAILAGASAQLRNMATTGGNLLQRTRCYYFYDIATPCNKRVPGSGCSALNGLHRMHAILGASDACIATHPSDMCVALAALEAIICVEGPKGERRIPMAEFHRLPGDRPELDTVLAADEIILAVELKPQSFGLHHTYIKIRDRASYAFALVSVAVGLELEGNLIRNARIALGGVAHIPWRVEEAERSLKGKPAEEAAFREVAELILRDARPLRDNAFKLPLAKLAITRALGQAAAGMPQVQSEKSFR